jgi:hypothetical protein
MFDDTAVNGRRRPDGTTTLPAMLETRRFQNDYTVLFYFKFNAGVISAELFVRSVVLKRDTQVGQLLLGKLIRKLIFACLFFDDFPCGGKGYMFKQVFLQIGLITPLEVFYRRHFRFGRIADR